RYAPFPDPLHDRSQEPYDQGADGGPGLRTQPLSRPAGGGCGGDAAAGRAASPLSIVPTAAVTNARARAGGTPDTSTRDSIGRTSRVTAEARNVRELQPRGLPASGEASLGSRPRGMGRTPPARAFNRGCDR